MRKNVSDSPSGDVDAWDRQATAQMRVFLETDDLAAFHRAIDLLRRAAAGHPDRARLLSNLCGALIERFERGAQPGDLDEAIEAGRTAVRVASSDDRNRAGYLSNLARGLVRRFEHAGELADLNEAVEAWRAAARAIPAHHPDWAEHMGNLGLALLLRFERVGQLADLEEAVQVGRAAVQATPADHPHRAMRLSNLDLALKALGEDGPPDQEAVVLYVRPHWYGVAKRVLRMPVLLVLAVVAVFFVPGWPDGRAILHDERAVLYVIIGVVAALLVKYSVLPWLQWVTTRYVVTTERLSVRKGFVRRRVVIDMPLSRIGEVGSHRFIVERLFGGGTLIVSSKDGRRRIVLPNMPNVTDVAIRLSRLARPTGR